MPKVKPIQVPRREDVPLPSRQPSRPSTPAPSRPVTPQKPAVPAKRMSGNIGGGIIDEVDKIIRAKDGDSAYDALDGFDERIEEILDDMKIGEIEDLIDELEKKYTAYERYVNRSELGTDELADRAMNGDNEGVEKYLIRWADMTKREAKKEAQRLIDLVEIASAAAPAMENAIERAQNRIKELEKDEF
jgi:hypothetical protein